ncbi:MAG: hypothetical protein K5756_09375 [Clostridiales bacterium]|nr:hypothetical protein [Clostridiales bacterium]
MDIKSILPITEQGFEPEKTEKYINYLQDEYEKIRRRCIELTDKNEALTFDNNRLNDEIRNLKMNKNNIECCEKKPDFPPSISTVNELFISRMLMDLLENSERMRIKTSEQIQRSINDFRLNLK